MWDACRDPDSGRNHWMVDFGSLIDSFTVSESALVRHELFDLLKRAEAGNCRFGPARQGGVVDQMAVAPNILELRLGWWTGEDGQKHIIRLYFTEPEELPGILYAAKLASKRPGPMGLPEQSQHALEAANRVDRALRLRSLG